MKKQISNLYSYRTRLINGLSQMLNVDVAYLVRGGFWLSAGYSGVTLLRLLLVVILAHFADRAFYGQYQLIFSILATILVFSLPGMNIAITQSVARGYDSSLITGTKSKLRWAVLGSIALLGVAGFFYFIKPEPIWYVFIFMALSFPLYACFSSIIFYYRGKENFRKAAIYNVLTSAITITSVIIVFFLTKSLLAIVLAMIIPVTFVYVLIYFKILQKIKSRKIDKGVVSYGKNLTFMTLFELITPHIDKFVIAYIAGFEGLAIYSIALAVVLHLGILGKQFSFLILPKLSRAKAHHFEKIKKLFWLASLGVVFCVIVLILIMPWLIPLLFSQKYVASVHYAQIAMVYLVFFLPSSILIAFFQGKKKTKLLYTYNFGTGVMNIVLLAVFVPLLGVFGAIISRVVLGLIGFVFLTSVFYTQKR